MNDNEQHLPAPSLWPFTVGAGVTLLAFGIVASLLFSVLGALLVAYGVVNWIREVLHD
jgi:hypothetical protein